MIAQTRWDDASLQNAVVAMLVKCALNSKINQSVTSKAPPPPCFTVGTTHAEIFRSPTLHLTKIWVHQTKGQISTGLMYIAYVS